MYTLHCLELIYSKNYFNPSKIFLLRLFKMVENQIRVLLEERSVIKFSVAEKYKSCEI